MTQIVLSESYLNDNKELVELAIPFEYDSCQWLYSWGQGQISTFSSREFPLLLTVGLADARWDILSQEELKRHKGTKRKSWVDSDTLNCDDYFQYLAIHATEIAFDHDNIEAHDLHIDPSHRLLIITTDADTNSVGHSLGAMSWSRHYFLMTEFDCMEIIGQITIKSEFEGDIDDIVSKIDAEFKRLSQTPK